MAFLRFNARWVLAGLCSLPAMAGPANLAGIVRLKDLHLKTALVREGAAACQIATPGDEGWRRLGRDVQAALEKKSGVRIEVLDAGAVREADYGRGNLILLGDLDNNAVIGKLYSQHYCFTDSHYPGKDGYEVRTIHNPMGWGVNFVLLGASDLAGGAEAVRHFAALLDDPRLALGEGGGRTLELARLDVSRSTFNAAESDERAYYETTTARLRKRLEAGSVLDVMREVSDTGMRYYQTGDEVYGRVFRNLMLRYCELAEPANDPVLMDRFGGDSNRYFYPLKLIPAWELIETGAVFSDADRLRFTNLMLNITRWLSRLDYFDPGSSKGRRYAVPGEIRNNHATFAASSLWAGLNYFRKYYPEIREFDGVEKKVANIFDGQRSSYRPDDNSATYSNYAPNHLLNYLFTRGDWTYMQQGYLREIADLVIMTTDNRGDISTYGDEIDFKIGYDKGLPLLAKAAWYYRDGRYLWARDWLARRSVSPTRGRASRPPREASGKTEFTNDGWYDGPYNLELDRREPDDLLGLKTIGMDEGLYRFARAHGKGGAVPREKTFDKLSLRRDFDPQDEYMLLGGLSGTLAHSHEDGNAVLRLTWKDRVWLANLHYRRKWTNAENSLLVRKNWRYRNVPTCASLESKVDFPEAGFTATAVTDYNGVDWDRNIIWSKGKYFLFLDSIRVREADDYCLNLNWRTLGEIRFGANALDIRQDGGSFNIKSADNSRKDFSTEPSDGRFVDWTPYEHAHDGTAKVMSQTLAGRFKRNERLAYVNLLYPGPGEGYGVRLIQPRVAQILRDRTVESLAGLAAEGCRVGNLSVTARIFRLTDTGITLVDGTQLSAAQPLLRSSGPIALDLDLKTGIGRVIATSDVILEVDAIQAQLDGNPAAAVSSRRAGGKALTIPKGNHELHLQLSPAWRTLSLALRTEPTPAAAPPPITAETEQGLAPRWRRERTQVTEVADLDGDGAAEIIAGEGDRVVALSPAGEVKWSRQVTGAVRTLRAIAGGPDGKKEIVVGTDSGFVHLLDSQGRERWKYECAYRPGPVIAFATADLDGNGRREILAGTQGYVLYALENDGRLRWYNMIDPPWPSVAALVAADFGGKGKPEIFVGSGADHGDVLLDGAGRKLWEASGTTTLAVPLGLSGAGEKRVVVGGPLMAGPVRFLDPADGSTVWKAEIDDDVKAIIPLRAGGREKGEVLVGYSAAGLWRMDGRGGQKRIREFSSPVNAVTVVDLGTSPILEIAVGCEDGRVVVIDGAGIAQASLKLAGAVTSIRAFQDHGQSGLVVTTRDGAAISLALGAGVAP